MNRKISTLLTAGLLVAGSLCGSAFAQTPTVSIKDLTGIGSTVANELKNGARYVMVDASSSLAYGHEISTTTGKIVEVGEAINTPIFYDDSDSKEVHLDGQRDRGSERFLLLYPHQCGDWKGVEIQQRI